MPNKVLHILMHGKPSYVITYRSYKLLKMVRFLPTLCFVFTALHGMQMWSSDENSVSLCVRPSHA